MPSLTQFKLPSLGSLKPSSGGGFVLPKLGNLSTNSVVPQSTSTLADFAKTQLQTDSSSVASNSQFTIPKLFASQPKTTSMEIEKTDSGKVVIDLKSALVSEMEQEKVRLVKTKVSREKSVEDFIPKFVDCDMLVIDGARDLTVTDCCELENLKQIRLRYKGFSLGKFSSVGKIITRKFRKKIPLVRHGYELNPNIVGFTFNTPSPDDKIIQRLKKS